MERQYYAIRRDDSDHNSLKHWKYVKKKKVNGKWRYYYDIKDAMGYDERERYNQAISNVTNAEREKNQARDNYNSVQKHYTDKYYRGEYVDLNTGALKEHVQPHYEEEVAKHVTPMYKKYEAKEAQYTKAGQEFCKAKEEYMKTPLGKIDNLSYTVKKGVEAVSKWFKKIFKR